MADLIKLRERTPSSKLRYWAKTQGDFVCPPSELLEQAADLLDECETELSEVLAARYELAPSRRVSMQTLLARLRGETKGER